MKKIFKIIGVTIFAVSFTTSAMAAQYNWTFQTSEASPTEEQMKIKLKWVKKIEEMSNGRIHIDLLTVGAVVPAEQVLSAISSGILQGGSNDPSYYSGKEPAFAMFANLVGAWSDPYQFVDYMYYGGGIKLFNEAIEPYGVHLIGATSTGVEAFISKKSLANGVKDLKGLKIRTPQGMVANVFQQAGAAPVIIAGSEVFTSLEKGVIDAADYTVLSTNYGQGFYGIAKYAMFPGWHSLPMVDITINKRIWDELPKDLKAILESSIQYLNYNMIETLKAKDKKVEALIKAKHPEIHIQNWSVEERKKFRIIAKKVWGKWSTKSKMSDKVYNSIINYLTEQGLL